MIEVPGRLVRRTGVCCSYRKLLLLLLGMRLRCFLLIFVRMNYVLLGFGTLRPQLKTLPSRGYPLQSRRQSRAFPAGNLHTPPAGRAPWRPPCFRRGHIRLLCGAGTARPRGRSVVGRESGEYLSRISYGLSIRNDINATFCNSC